MDLASSSKTYWASATRVRNYLAKAPQFPYAREADQALLKQVPLGAARILDLGTGDGHLVALLRQREANCEYVGVDFSKHMLRAAEARFRDCGETKFLHHDLNEPLSGVGKFDVIVSRLATHNLSPRRQLRLYAEIFELLRPGGVFCNIEHIPASTARMHKYFYEVLGDTADCFDSIASKPPSIATHLRWLRELEFGEIGCRWRWFEIALIVGRKQPVIGDVLATPAPSPSLVLD